MNMALETDTVVFSALRVYRNAFLGYCRVHLQQAFGGQLDGELQELFRKEWEVIVRSADEAYTTGFVERQPIDALDYLSVNHTAQLLEKYWAYLCPLEDPGSEAGRRLRTQLIRLTRDLIGVRNPVSHSPEENLSLREALRYIDAAIRILDILRLPQSQDLRAVWDGVVAESTTIGVAPPAVLDTLPSRELISLDFVGRSEQLAVLWQWLDEDTRRIWALVGDGGKGKTTIAYEFTVQARGVLDQYGLQGILWLTAKKRRFVEGEIVPTITADFWDLESALDWILDGLGWIDEQSLPFNDKQARCLELLREFPMLIIVDDIDSLAKEDEEAVEFFSQHVPQTGSKVLLTSRREIFGLGSCTTVVSGMAELEVDELVRRRAPQIGLEPEKITGKLVKKIRAATDGSPLYIEDLLRLAQFYSIETALSNWSGRSGDAAREYALKIELEKLSEEAVSVLGVLAYSPDPLSLQECAVIVGLTDDQAEVAMGELRNWNLLVKPGLVEEVPRFSCSLNLSKLTKRTFEGTDRESRIRNGLKGMLGVRVGSGRVRKYIQQAVALKQRGEEVEAERLLLTGLEEVPNSGEVHAMLGWLYSKWRPSPRVTDAQENFTKAEALGSWSRDLYAHWADMELSQGEVRKAIAICERSVGTAAKDDPFTWKVLGVAYTQHGRSLQQQLSTEEAISAYDSAGKALNTAQRLSKDAGELSRVLGARYQLARTRGDVDRAAEVLDEWERLVPGDPFLATARK